jgi:type II secretory pathway pseudopilin PulG
MVHQLNSVRFLCQGISMPFPSRKQRPALTLVELLVVLAIGTIFLSLMITVVYRVKENANRVECQHNLKQLVLAVHGYHADYRTMPPYASGKHGEIFGGWFIYLTPYAGYQDVKEIIAEENQPSPGKNTVLSSSHFRDGVRDKLFPTLLCPSDPTRDPESDPGKTNYLANWYAFGVANHGPYSPRQSFGNLTDGLSNVALFAEGYSMCDDLPRKALLSVHFHNFGITQERKPSDDPSYFPQDYTMFQVGPTADNCDKWRTQTGHATMNTALADGSVRSFQPNISPDTWKQLLKPRDGNPIFGEW